jgi:ABC-type microcin C transport system duplicated ATPase subunit YejF
VTVVTPLLSVRGLSIQFRTGSGIVDAVRGLDFHVMPGETVAVVGESGSGKSQSMLAIMGLLANNGQAQGSVRFADTELIGASDADLDRHRGSALTMIFQEPMTSLDPLYRIGHQLAAPLRCHAGMTRAQARTRAIALLEMVQIQDPIHKIDAYPHELSGGQRQRVMIAMAIALKPALLIADEPTTALDVTVQAEILGLLRDLQKQMGLAILFVTHDLGLVRRIADRVIVMHNGICVEQAKAEALFESPKHAYTKRLIEAAPKGLKAPIASDARTVLDARAIRVTFGGRRRLRDIVRGAQAHEVIAVNGVDLLVRAGETVGVVGESGSGKSTLGRAVLKLVAASGHIRFEDRNLAPLDRAAMRPLRRQMQIVFQDPFGSLSPRLTVGEIVSEGLLVHEPGLSRADRDQRMAKAFEDVRLDPNTRNRFPHEFSGGQRQRLAIARAMILKPKLLVLDEPTSALDRSVQGDIIELLRDMQTAGGLAYVFISHDLAVIRAVADRIVVMKDGVIVETGSTAQIMETPREPYTRVLIAAAFLDTPHMERPAG